MSVQPQAALLDFSTDEATAGFRLSRFEWLNWGTFDGAVFRMDVGGANALVTGDIGSGKSTLVDGLTVLLVPPQKVSFNKAAGAETRERSLASYVRGDYKAERGETARNARAVSLRADKHLTVLLATFVNRGLDQTVCLGQVLWFKPGEPRPERFHVYAETALDIAGDFAGHSDPLALKKALKTREHVEIPDSFTRYEQRFRAAMGIDNRQALELFSQTISMKSVANLTDFVREHMLEPGDASQQIEALKRNFDNLDAAHRAVQTAREQIDALDPLVADGRAHGEQAGALADDEAARAALPAWFASHAIGLLDERLKMLRLEQDKLGERVHQARTSRDVADKTMMDLRLEIERAGGGRLREIEQQIDRLTSEQARLKTAADAYAGDAQALELGRASGEHAFHRNRQAAETILRHAEEQADSLTQRRVDLGVQRQTLTAEADETRAEIESLKARRSSIDRHQLAIRQALCEALDLPESELPFAGELIRVRDDAQRWQGAIERLLRGFGLSLLVPERHHKAVARFVDATHLRGRLVYFRVGGDAVAPRSTGAQSVVRKLQIKPDAPAAAWLEAELARRFDYHCAENLDDFRRHSRAITRAGQVSHGKARHEKDDRHAVDDRRRWVLGWNNADKIAALLDTLSQLDAEVADIDGGLAGLKDKQAANTTRRDTAQRMLAVTRFADIDWRGIAKSIDALRAEADDLRQSSDVLATLQARLSVAQAAKQTAADELETINQRAAQNQAHISRDEQALTESHELLAEVAETEREALFGHLVAAAEALGAPALTELKSLNKHQREMNAGLSARIDATRKRLERLRDRVLRQMSAFKTAYPADTTEVDAALEALPAYAAMLQQRRDDDLPRFEATFRERLREGTINDIAALQNGLDLAERAITGKIARINASLAEIDYDASAGTYIELAPEPAADTEIAEFKRQLQACLADTLGDRTGGDDAATPYTEAKFAQVKALVDRFNGREGYAELDARWAAKVSDVRNGFEFSARELWRTDSSEREFYAGSSGKSGGQKEKLAYTILAASLAYQFGLQAGRTTARSFRFVIIDEAFGRGSDESAQYGLQLFDRLNLQLLIVTPLQKIHVIEDFVASVHYVHNEAGQHSQVRSLTIDAYRREKQASRS